MDKRFMELRVAKLEKDLAAAIAVNDVKAIASLTYVLNVYKGEQEVVIGGGLAVC